MKKTKIRAIVAALSALLLVVASILGTIAYLTDTSVEVKNTFVVGKLFPDDDENNFVIYEHEAHDGDETSSGYDGTTIDGEKDGVYKLHPSETVTANKYDVLPGVDIPKDPCVATNKEPVVDAYVFIEVINGADDVDGVTAEVNSTNWTKIDYQGEHGGDIYVMALNGGIATAGQKLSPVYILKDNKVTVSDKFNETTTSTETTNAESSTAAPEPESLDFDITFYGYMIQKAGFADCNEAAQGLGFISIEID